MNHYASSDPNPMRTVYLVMRGGRGEWARELRATIASNRAARRLGCRGGK